MANKTYTHLQPTLPKLDVPLLDASELGTIHIHSNQTVNVTQETMDTSNPAGGTKVFSVGFVDGSSDLCGTFAGTAATYPAVPGASPATCLTNNAQWQNYKIMFETPVP